MNSTAWFHLPNLGSHPASAVLSPDESRHLARSRRLSTGKRIVVFDGFGTTATAEVTDVSGRRAWVELKLMAYHYTEQTPLRVHLISALPKGERQAVMLDMVTQLGATDFTPLLCERSVAKFSERAAVRWQRVLVEACKQSRRPWFPQLHSPQPPTELVKNDLTTRRTLWVADSGGESIALVSRVRTGELILLVGPEGGFSAPELDQLQDAGAQPVSLSDSTLRTETAAVTLVAAAMGGFGS